MTCIIFDVDDTIVKYEDFDYEEWYSKVGASAARELGIPMTVEIWKAITSGKESRRYPEKFGVSTITFWKKVDENNLQYRKEMLSSGKIRLYEDAKIIPELPGTKIAWSASSTECVKFVLSALNVLSWFDEIYGKDFGNYEFIDTIKPGGGLLREILKRHNCKNCFVIGDSPKDMMAARQTHCRGIRIARDSGEGIRSLRELKNIIK